MSLAINSTMSYSCSTTGWSYYWGFLPSVTPGPQLKIAQGQALYQESCQAFHLLLQGSRDLVEGEVGIQSDDYDQGKLVDFEIVINRRLYFKVVLATHMWQMFFSSLCNFFCPFLEPKYTTWCRKKIFYEVCLTNYLIGEDTVCYHTLYFPIVQLYHYPVIIFRIDLHHIFKMSWLEVSLWIHPSLTIPPLFQE